jgi:hypothetical protein
MTGAGIPRSGKEERTLRCFFFRSGRYELAVLRPTTYVRVVAVDMIDKEFPEPLYSAL